jgi:hypothetical protein
LVRKAIAQLLKEGTVYHQIDGVVYVPRDDKRTGAAGE